MMSKEAMKLALFALDIVKIHYTQNRHINEAIAALKERLADPMREVQRLGQEIEAAQRTWVEIDDEDWIKALELCDFDKVAAFDFFEAKLKEKNT